MTTKVKTKTIFKALYQAISLLIVAIALGYLLSINFYPIVKVGTDSMEPTYTNGDILLCKKTSNINRSDDVLFYIGNKLQIKKVIGLPGETLNITNNGKIYINGFETDYCVDNNKGDIEYPIIIKEREYFVLNNDRSDIADSRSSEVGNVKQDDIYALVLYKLWPRGNNND